MAAPDRSPALAAGRPETPKVSVVNGAAANTNIAISGISLHDRLIEVVEYQPPTAGSGSTIVGDRTAEASITSAGNIQLSTTDTTGNQLLVRWRKRRPA